MLHTALATAPDRPMVPAAATVAGVALVGAMVALTARVLLVPHPAAAESAPPAVACSAADGCTPGDARDAPLAAAPR
jgi:hypothetical protein